MNQRARVGRASRRRIRAGGPRALGRRAASVEEWKAIREQVLARARWRCQACWSPGRLEVHHVLKRSQGGSDFDLDLLVALCRACHAQTDAPYAKERLVVTPLGRGQFVFEVVHQESKWEVKRSVPREGSLPMWANSVSPAPCLAREGGTHC